MTSDQKTAADTATSLERGARTASALPEWAGPLLIIAAGAVTYANSFRGAFVFDDRDILTNQYIRRLWPPLQAMFAPPNVSRPLIGLSLAVNHQISGLDVWSYHAVNLMIHVLAALTLFGIVRRTLASDRMRERYGAHSSSLALVVALIWVVHPLQTQSVTYIIQRCESLMGLFYLLTLYCAIRAFASPRKRLWYAAAIAACFAGMMSKQVMATAPVAVIIYDVMFESDSLKKALRARWPLFTGLAAAWLVLGAIIAASPANPTAGFEVATISSWDYFKSEFAVIAHYLRLSVWPNPLVLDYEWPKAASAGGIIPFAIIVGVPAAATVWALLRRWPIGYLGAWFFLIISLTSSIMPFNDLAFEHRMYLPLAAVVTLIVLGAFNLGSSLLKSQPALGQRRRLAGMLAMVVVTISVTVLSIVAIRRNQDYQSDVLMWADVVEKRPGSARARNNLGMLLVEQGRVEAGVQQFSEACRINSSYAKAHVNLGSALTAMGRTSEAEPHLRQALELKPGYAEAYYCLGRALAAEGRVDEAISSFSRAIESNPDYAEAYFNRGLAFRKERRFADAVNDFGDSLRKHPDSAEVLSHLAVTLAAQDDPSLRNPGEAVRLAERAVALTGGRQPVPLDALAIAYAEMLRFDEAIKAARLAVDLARDSGDTELVNKIEARLQLYREQRVWRSPATAPQRLAGAGAR